jgi:hypothetical protein
VTGIITTSSAPTNHLSPIPPPVSPVYKFAFLPAAPTFNVANDMVNFVVFERGVNDDTLLITILARNSSTSSPIPVLVRPHLTRFKQDITITKGNPGLTKSLQETPSVAPFPGGRGGKHGCFGAAV